MKIKLTGLIACVFMCVCAFAQITTTTIIGTVTDSTGGTIPNAKVTATNTGTNLARSVETDSEGQYTIDLLPVGTYQVDVAAQGFKKYRQSGITLDINRTARVDAVLDIGALTDTVTVTGDAPLVNTSNPQIGRTVSNRQITDLPIVNRNVYTLLTLTPGVESSANSIVLGYPEQRTMINGGTDGGAGTVNYFLDGGTNMTGLRNTGNILPNPDAVQEFRVITNSYSAEFGRFSGGVINIITKSGTNQLHGSLFEFLRNDKLNANLYDAVSKAPLRRNQFGGSIGGPIKKDKTFFFGTYSGLRQEQPQFFNAAVVPTPAQRTGDFSSLAASKQPTDPLNGQPFPGGIIPVSRFDPTALNILNKYIPLANAANGIYQAQVANPYNTDEYLAKMDHSLTGNQLLTLSYYETSGRNVTQPAGNLPWSVSQYTWRQQNANASDTWTISPNTVNQLWVTYSRNFGGRLNLPQMSLGDLGSAFRPQGTPSLPQITVTGFFTLGQSIAGPVAGTNFYQVRDSTTWTHGRHSVKFGGELTLEKDIQDTLLNNYGVFSFTGTKSNNALSDFLLGLPVTMNQDAPVTAEDNGWAGGLFVQDDWRILPRLTLNLGLRWDVQTPLTDQHNREMTFEQGVQSTVSPTSPVGLLFPGDPGVTRGVIPTRWHNFSPRAGLAWDPFGDGKTSIRAAGGIFYGSISGNEWNSMSNNQPFAIRQQFNNVASLTNPYGLLPGGVSPYPYSYNPQSPKYLFPAAIEGVSPDFQWPYTYQFNFSVQRQITSDFSMTAAYVGSFGHRLPFQQDVNYPIFNSTATTGNVNNRRPIQPGTLSTLSLIKSIMNTSYSGLQITAEKKMARHFMLQGFYTFSKTMDGAQLDNSTTAGGAEDMNNLALEKGLSDFGRRHNFVTSIIWTIDYVHGGNALVRGLANGWMLSSIVSLRSGQPFTVTAGKDVNLDGTNNDRANLTGNPFLDPHRSQNAVTNEWFDTNAFTVGANGTDGTAGRNILIGPGTRDVDLGLFRDFKIRESIQLQFRAEMTNALNMVSLGLPGATFGSALFGKITASGPTGNDMRQTQLGLRLAF
ncbi:MAG TPA: TonB-dependent receptor [Bryobacteraceae bacterium]|nr:TonB-dependent receptor [Bryobacteraceae bacterium]